MGSLRRDDEDHDCPCARLSIRGAIDTREAFIDASFAPAKKGGSKVGKTKRGKGTKIMAVADRNGLPVSVCAESATPHEVTLATSTLHEWSFPRHRRT
jgi:hypothetical protein